MNCDEVFEILTRGPFPSGHSSDEAVEQHLAECPECARLAHALEPALELMHEALEPEEAVDLPEYWGRLAGESARPVATNVDAPRRAEPQRVAQDQPHETPQPAPERSSWRRSWVAIAGSAAAVILLSGVLAGLIVPHEPASEVPAMRSVESPSSTMSSESLGLASACLEIPLGLGDSAGDGDARNLSHSPTSVNRRLTLPDGRSLACCTSCHSSAAPHGPTIAVPIARLTQSCLLCHVN